MIPVKCDITTHEIEQTDETVLFDDRGGQLLVLNAVGAAVWLLADGERDIVAIAREIAETLGETEAKVRSDVEAFVGTLKERGLVELRQR